jgi:hypothetical protein
MMDWCAGGLGSLSRYPSSFYLVRRSRQRLLPNEVILSNWIKVSAASRPSLELKSGSAERSQKLSGQLKTVNI